MTENTASLTNNDGHLSVYDSEQSVFLHASDQLLERLAIQDLSQDQVAAVRTVATEFVLSATDGDASTVGFGDLSSLMEIEERLAVAAGADSYTITPELCDANRLFTGMLIESLSGFERAGDERNAQALASAAYDNIFSVSPNPSSYSGELGQRFGLLALAEATPMARKLLSPMIGELVYSMAYGYDAKTLSQAIRHDAPVLQIHAVGVLDSMANWAIDNGEWADPALNKIRQALHEAESDDSISTLVKRIADAKLNTIDSELNTDWVYLDDMPAEERDAILLRHNTAQAQYAKQQLQLRTDYPRLDPEQSGVQLVRLASDCAATVQAGRVWKVEFADDSSDDPIAYLDTVKGDAKRGITADQAMLIRELHNPAVRSLIEAELGVALADISLSAQLQLLGYMSASEKNEYQRLCAVANTVDVRARPEFCEAFLAMQFGQDFANVLLTIAENNDATIAEEVFKLTAGYRRDAAAFGSWYEQFDKEFASDTTHALDERLADGLEVIARLSRGQTAGADVHFGRLFRMDTLDEALEVMRLAGTSMSIMTTVMSDPNVVFQRVTKPNGQFDMYRVTSELYGQMLVYVRPEGAKGYDRSYEYGGKNGVEASVSFIVNPLTPDHVRSDKDPNGVSFRFDREGRLPGEAPTSPDRDPTRNDGLVSLDVSSILGNELTPSVRIGRFFAAGNVLRSERIGAQATLHHNSNYFNQDKYGAALGFRSMANYTKAMLESGIALSHGRTLGAQAMQAVDVASQKSVA